MTPVTSSKTAAFFLLYTKPHYISTTVTQFNSDSFQNGTTLQLCVDIQMTNKSNEKTLTITSRNSVNSGLPQRDRMCLKSSTYSRVREGILSLSRRDFILAEQRARA